MDVSMYIPCPIKLLYDIGEGKAIHRKDNASRSMYM